MSHFRKNILSILLTTECNLACRYCITGSSQQENQIEIDLDFAKSGIDYFFNTTSSRWIRFYSVGEPTLAFTKMHQITEYARQKCGSALTVELQHNGTCAYSNEVRDWIKSNVDWNFISFDGLPEIHDQYRKTKDGDNTSEQIIENIIYFLKFSKNIGIRCTITEDLIYRQKEIIDYWNDLGLKYIFSKNVIPSLDKRISNKEIDFMKFAKEFVIAHKYAKTKDIFYGSGYICGFDEKAISYCRQAIPAPHLTPDGFVSSCDRACLGTTSLPELLYGEFNKKTKNIEIDGKSVKRIQNRNIYNLIPCQDCEIAPYCAGNCTGTAYQKTGNMMGIVKEYCEPIKYMYRELNWENGFFPCFHP